MTKGKWAIVLYEACRLVAVVVLVAVVGAVYLAGKAKATAPKVLRAQAFELLDATGKVRGALSFGQNGSPMLALRDKNGQLRARLSMTFGGPSVDLADEKGKMRASLVLRPDGSPELWLADEKGEGRAVLEVGPNGRPSLGLFDERGNGRAVLGLFPDGRPTLQLLDDQGKSGASLGAMELVTTRTGAMEKRAESSLVLLDKEGKVMWKVP